MTGKPGQSSPREKKTRSKERRPGRMLAAFKALVLLALIAVTAYGALRSGIYTPDLWLPVAAGTLGLLFITLFVGNYYRDVPRVGWVLVALLAILVGIKGLSMVWTISETETIRELLRSSMYLAIFVLALAAVSSGRQVVPLIDAAILIIAAVAGYGLMQKIDPVTYPATSLDAARIGSTVEYPNSAAMLFGMGVVLGLARMTEMRRPLTCGLYGVLVLVFGAALYFTFSRGGILALGVGLVVLFVLGGDRLQALVNLLLAAGPLAWLLHRAQSLEPLFMDEAPEARLLEAGLSFRTDLLVAAVAAFVLQAVYALLASRYELLPGARRALGAAVLVVAVMVVGVGAYLLGGQIFSADFSEDLTGRMQEGENAGERLTSVNPNSRSQYWQVAWQEWKEYPLTGTGAGTFQYTWLQDRPGFGGVKQVHSLYLEQGTETGIFAFLTLTGFAALLVLYVARAAWRSAQLQGRRVLLSGLAAALVVYLFSSALEWHWYIPGSTLLFFLLAAGALKFANREDWTLPEEDAGRP